MATESRVTKSSYETTVGAFGLARLARLGGVVYPDRYEGLSMEAKTGTSRILDFLHTSHFIFGNL